MKTIYLVRHGESEINVSDMYVNTLTSPLTELGREQARLLADRAARIQFDVLLSSPIARAKETAETIATVTRHSIEYFDVFRERALPASITGRPKSDPEAKAMADAAVHASEHGTTKVEDAETFYELKERAGRAIQLLEERPEKNILVVGHGFFTRVLIARMLFGEDLTVKEFAPFVWGMRTKNTGISVLRYDPSDKHRPWWMLVWNDHAHLG
ncbi:MAG: histidine phosphatase family protein [Minisyncoccota bacterium]